MNDSPFAISIPQNGEKSTSKTKKVSENDGKLRGALDVAQNKASRVIVAQFASSKAIANTPHSPRLNNSIPQNGEKSTSKTKKVSESDGIVDRKSLDDDLFDKDAFFANAMENGGVISHEEAEAIRANSKREPEKSQTSDKKPSEGRKQEHAAEVAERINQPLLLEEANILGKLTSANAKEIGATMVGQLHKATSSAHFSSPIKHSIADFLHSVKSLSLTNEV